MKVETVTIIGLQKIGTSAGLAIKQKASGLTIIGHDRTREVMQKAKTMGAVDQIENNLISAVRKADILILTETLPLATDTWRAIGLDIPEHTVVLDFGPLKKPIQKAADKYAKGKHYVGVMPIISADHVSNGSDLTADAAADLFQDSTFCLMPSPTVDSDAVDTAQTIGKLLGATPFYIDVEEYDIYIQAVETLPALISAAYFRALTNQSGWRDIKRVAGAPFAAVTEQLTREAEISHLTFSNKQASLHWIDTMIGGLEEMKQWIANGDKETLGALATELNIQRDEWLHERKQNNWTEGAAPEVKRRGLGEQLLGGWINRSND